MTEQTHAERVAANVRAEMARRSYSQRQLAADLGIAQQGLSQRLNGRVPFRVNELDRIAAILGVDLAALIAP